MQKESGQNARDIQLQQAAEFSDIELELSEGTKWKNVARDLTMNFKSSLEIQSWTLHGVNYIGLFVDVCDLEPVISASGNLYMELDF